MRENVLSSTRPLTDSGSSIELRTPPNHVAIIMDGNGRWAVGRGLTRPEGHRAGLENIRRILRCFIENGVKYVTLFAFSTENWTRPAIEVEALMDLLEVALRNEVQPLHEQDIQIRLIGQLGAFSVGLQRELRRAVKLTEDNRTLTLSVAVNYGGRAEIIEAVQAMISDHLHPSKITEEVFESYLYTAELPDPDLIVRTAGEMRLSNFLLWQSAYSEYYSTSVLWPDFDESEVEKALAAFQQRRRRYGSVTQD